MENEIIEAEITKGGEVWLGKRLKIKVGRHGYDSMVYIDDEKLKGLTKVTLIMTANKLTKIEMEMHPDLS